MAKFLLFAWQQYEERAGLDALEGVYDTFLEAQQAVLNLLPDYDTAQIAIVENDIPRQIRYYSKSTWRYDPNHVPNERVPERWVRGDLPGNPIEVDFTEEAW